MALFSNNSKKTKKAVTPGSSVAKSKALAREDGRLSTVLKAPWFSEKALIASTRGVYVFEIPADATKPEVAAAIEKFYNVTPVKVRVAHLPAKTVSLRTRRGQGSRARRHKAYVYLQEGQTLNLV